MTRDQKNRGEPERSNGSVDMARPQRPLSADLQAHIGIRLKAYYDSVLAEPIPPRFAELLDRLDGAEAPLNGSGGGAASQGTRSDPAAEPPSSDPTGSDVTT